MTEGQKKTLGMAIASFVLGLFFIIPVLGWILGLVAIILGIVALVTISKNSEALKGKGFAIAGIIMGAMAIVIVPLVAIIAAIAVPSFINAKNQAGVAMAEARVRQLYNAIEMYYVENGEFPRNMYDLTSGESAYIDAESVQGTVNGYTFTVDFGDDDFEITAAPADTAGFGSRTMTMGHDGVLRREEAGVEY